MFSKKFDRRVSVLVAVTLLASGFGTAFGLYALWPGNRERGYEPEQPLAYNHRLHAGTLKIHCRYCHWNVEVSAPAAVPSISVCMNCHAVVQPKNEKGAIKPELAKLLAAWKTKTPIRWEKVHNLADFVYFDHSRHIASGLECQECHGPVETMERVRRDNALVMGWCLACHRKPPPEADRPMQASVDCTTCHR